ncbi:Transcriptional regulator, AcrR family [hydrothermal vent metagenome]|uniref:Transcriptional regulator, AcrR family n=1 Tax=hydrothermal vent metagenome TaxID=652676 RepID=A0A3B0UMG4_9ZZZZ
MKSTKEHIIKQSAALFNTKGYNGCSLHDIMQATGLKKGGIYNYFKNKDEIAFESFDYSFELIKLRFKDALSRCSNSYEKIMAIITVFASFHNDPVTIGGCPIFNTAVDSSGIHPSLTEKARKAINHLKRYIEIKIDEGIESNEFKPGIKSEELSTLILTSMEGALIMARVNSDTGPVQTIVKHLTKIITENTK